MTDDEKNTSERSVEIPKCPVCGYTMKIASLKQNTFRCSHRNCRANGTVWRRYVRLTVNFANGSRVERNVPETNITLTDSHGFIVLTEKSRYVIIPYYNVLQAEAVVQMQEEE